RPKPRRWPLPRAPRPRPHRSRTHRGRWTDRLTPPNPGDPDMEAYRGRGVWRSGVAPGEGGGVNGRVGDAAPGAGAHMRPRGVDPGLHVGVTRVAVLHRLDQAFELVGVFRAAGLGSQLRLVLGDRFLHRLASGVG